MPFASTLAASLLIHLLVVEYPGYGVRKKDSDADPKSLLDEAKHLIYFLTEIVGIDPSNLILCGRSIGCAPVMYLASQNFGFGGGSLGGIVLVSPFLSLREVVKQWLGSNIGGFFGKNIGEYLFGIEVDEGGYKELEDKFESVLQKDEKELYDLENWVKSVRVPALFIHGEEDKVVDKSHSEVSLNFSNLEIVPRLLFLSKAVRNY